MVQVRAAVTIVSIIPSERSDAAITVRADGDCLPACGSVFIFRNDRYPAEIRTRIAIEHVVNDHFYLNENMLLQDMTNKLERRPL